MAMNGLVTGTPKSAVAQNSAALKLLVPGKICARFPLNSLSQFILCNRSGITFVLAYEAGHRPTFIQENQRISLMGRLLLILLFCTGVAFGQQSAGSIKGQISDEFGGVIVGASVIAVNAQGVEKTVATNGEGNFVINGLAPGKYTIKVTAIGFATFENPEFEVVAGRVDPLNVTLKVTIEQQKVTVAADSTGVNTDPENNIGAIVLKGADLESLPDDPDDLAAALQALAGPGAGPNGGQIFIDGFSNGRLPPLSSIREIRINSNPYSAEYDRPGFGRIEILTKPGTDRFRGQASFSYNNQSLNSRNPFASTRPPYMSRQYGGNLSGPISKKKASFFVDFEKRDINDDAIINATVLDPSLNIVTFSDSVPTPNRRTTFSPRVDYQLNASNTLVARYEYTHTSNITGVGGFSLRLRKYEAASTEHNIRLTETAILNKTTVNETRFQFTHQRSSDTADNSIPTIQVQEAFTGGGSQIGLTANGSNRWEVTNNTTLSKGLHTLRFGGRLRGIQIDSFSPQNFGGMWTFSGTRSLGDPGGLTSIEAYQITLQGLQAGLTPTAIRLAGGGATQFTIAAGQPQSKVTQIDFGGFAQDDWKMRPNLMLSFGMRYENQANINSNLNFAPRFGFAWQPGASPQHPSKTTIRGGMGVFYDRVSENLTLTANRLNGTNQQQYIVTDPAVLNSFPVIPSLATITAFKTPVSIYQLSSSLQAPYTIQSAISVERALPHNFTTSMTYSHARTLHLLRTRAINAPLPGTFIPALPGSGVRPMGSTNNYFEYDSTGFFDQNQFIFTVGSRLSRNLSFSANYTFSHTNSDSDGTGTFASNPYDFTSEYGRSSNDVRHRVTFFGNYRARWGISLSPFVIIASGAPFNITVGRDLNGDTVFTDRPSFATDLTKPGVVITRYGAFDLNPVAGSTIIPRNYGSGPSSLTANLRVSKTWGFGTERRTAANQTPGQGNRGAGGDRGNTGGAPRGGLGGGARGGGGGGGGARGGGGGGGGGGFGGGGFGGGEAPKRYNLTLSVNFQNILNHANLGRPVGNLSSSLFGLSTSSGGGFGGFGGGRGGGGSAPYNRLIDAAIRFTF
jgi:Carboxypeptidase regulatory-like domain